MEGALVALFVAIFVAIFFIFFPPQRKPYLKRVAKKYGIPPLGLR